MYLGHLPEPEEAEGFAAVEFAHHDLLNQVLDDDDGRSKYSTVSISSWHFRMDHARYTRFVDFVAPLAATALFFKIYHAVADRSRGSSSSTSLK